MAESKESLNDCREAFEVWYRSTYREAPLVNQESDEVDGIEYAAVNVRLRWDGWQAAWELQDKRVKGAMA